MGRGMTRKTILTLGAAATGAVIGAIAIPAIAGGRGPHDGWGPRQMMQRMHGDEAGCMQDGRGPGMLMQRGGHGPMGMADTPVTRSRDAEDDGEFSAEEMAFPAQRMARMRLMHVNDADTDQK